MYILQYTKSMLKLGQFLCHLVIYLYQHPRILNFWEFEPKLGQADILGSNGQKSRNGPLHFYNPLQSQIMSESIQHFDNPLFNIHRNTQYPHFLASINFLLSQRNSQKCHFMSYNCIFCQKQHCTFLCLIPTLNSLDKHSLLAKAFGRF